jgi:hypothetical protein
MGMNDDDLEPPEEPDDDEDVDEDDQEWPQEGWPLDSEADGPGEPPGW